MCAQHSGGSHTISTQSLESSLHIYQRPRYRSHAERWHQAYSGALAEGGDVFTWDTAAIMSILAFGYSCGDRTLLTEVRRQPWLSEICSDGSVQLASIPAHDTFWVSPIDIARNLMRLLREEIVTACRGRREVYLLLSGGLDSRIVAAVTAKAHQEGEIDAKPTAVTWGREDSRDMVYGKKVADILGIEWVPVDLTVADLEDNIDNAATLLGGLVCPMHLHRMSWFKNVSPQALVLAASYGDSVGRAEYSKKSLMELKKITPLNKFGLLRPSVETIAGAKLSEDLRELRNRSERQPQYVMCEVDMQGQYMRGMIGQSMSLINEYCDLYFPFTDPKVYSYMWSIHPSRRTDNVYAELLEMLDSRLARLPWARTNRALRPPTEGAEIGLSTSFHRYREWGGELITGKLADYLRPEWFADQGVFDGCAISNLIKSVRNRSTDLRCYEVLLWLATMRRFAEHVVNSGKCVSPIDVKATEAQSSVSGIAPRENAGRIRRWLRDFAPAYAIVRAVRRPLLRAYARRKYPTKSGANIAMPHRDLTDSGEQA